MTPKPCREFSPTLPGLTPLGNLPVVGGFFQAARRQRLPRRSRAGAEHARRRPRLVSTFRRRGCVTCARPTRRETEKDGARRS